MRVAVFFACLCFLVIRGYNCIYTGTAHNNLNYTEARNVQKAFQVKNNQYDITIQDTCSDKEEEYLVDDDVEDGEPHSLFARKYKLLTNSNLAHPHLSCLHYLHSCSKTPLDRLRSFVL